MLPAPPGFLPGFLTARRRGAQRTEPGGRRGLDPPAPLSGKLPESPTQKSLPAAARQTRAESLNLQCGTTLVCGFTFQSAGWRDFVQASLGSEARGGRSSGRGGRPGKGGSLDAHFLSEEQEDLVKNPFSPAPSLLPRGPPPAPRHLPPRQELPRGDRGPGRRAPGQGAGSRRSDASVGVCLKNCWGYCVN